MFNLVMSKKLSQPKICPECKKENSWFSGRVCNNCYKQKIWQRKKNICPRCKRLLFLKAKGLCAGCYNTTFHLDYLKASQHMKRYGLDFETYKKITEKCAVCDFDKFVALHHLDQDRTNNSRENLIGLCPNHHQMLHTQKYREEVFQELREKCFNPQEKKFRTDIKGGY